VQVIHAYRMAPGRGSTGFDRSCDDSAEVDGHWGEGGSSGVTVNEDVSKNHDERLCFPAPGMIYPNKRPRLG